MPLSIINTKHRNQDYGLISRMIQRSWLPKRWTVSNLIPGGPRDARELRNLESAAAALLAWRGVVCTSRIASFPFTLPQVHRRRERIQGVIWIQGNCILREAEGAWPLYARLETRTSSLDAGRDSVSDFAGIVYCSSPWQNRRRETRSQPVHLLWGPPNQ